MPHGVELDHAGDTPPGGLPYARRRGGPRWLLQAAAGFSAVTILAILVIDEPVAHALAGWNPMDRAWTFLLDTLEWGILLPIFSWLGATLLVLAMLAAVIVPRWRARAPAWMLVASTHIVARIVTTWLKVGTGRLRPYEWRGGDMWLQPKGVSFPSGHIALFASLLIPLAVVAPRIGRPVMFTVVPLVMLARVAASAHFVSDVTGGVALVCVLTWLLAAIIRPT